MANKPKTQTLAAQTKPHKEKFAARKFFTASHETALVPNLIEVQLNSYRWFVEKGLKELLSEVNPIRDFTGKNLELTFGEYFFDKPKPSGSPAKAALVQIRPRTIRLYLICFI